MARGVRRVYVIQDADSGEFLYPSPDGDVGFTKFLRDAGRQEDPEEAIETAQINLGNAYVISSFWEEMSH
jgi:hypothetical protein